MNLLGKSCKKWLISWKSMKNHRFDKNLQLLEETVMFGGFDEIFGKTFQKVADFVKKHEKSSIWPKLATFRENHHVSRF